ncbi:MAG: ATP-binding protein, partial [Spirulinaceae cyanobacterium]
DYEGYLSYGNEQGEFVGVEYRQDSTVQLKIRTSAIAPQRETYLLDDQGEPKELLKASEYDPRTRPWYNAAKEEGEATWSEIYPFFSSKNTILGISPVYPLYDAQGKLLGVLCINVRLTRITDFINHLSISPNGQSFIMERSGNLVAGSEIPQPFKVIGEEKDKEIERIPADQSDNPVVKATAQHLLASFGEFQSIQESERLKFQADGAWYYAQVLPIQDGRGSDWLTVVVVPEQDFMEEINNNARTTIFLCLAALVIATLIGIATSRWVIGPILRLNASAKAIAQGEWQQTPVSKRSDELGELATSFNSMAQQLQTSFATLESKNQALQKFDKLKDEFLANTSHELRTPLNGMIGIAESMIDGATGKMSPLQRQNLALVAQSGHRLSSLINDILDFAKLRHKNIELQLKPVGLRAVVEVVLSLNKTLVRGRNVQLINAVPRDLPAVEADENRLQQILHNLIGNAIKFTEQGSIEVHAELMNEQQSITVTISDTGIGIPADKLDSIFTSFEQADGSTAREYGGTGLGLAVTKKLVELHKGRIWVKSAVGEGSEFSFTLPVSSVDASAFSLESSLANRSVPKLLSSEEIEVDSSPQAPNSEGFKILIVDDEPVNLQVLVNHLCLENYVITQAANGKEALAVLENGLRPNVILLDVMMPKMTGYEVCKKIRKKFPAHELPILMLTAKNQVNDLVEGLQVGANDYLTKPINKNELLARLKTHLKLANISMAYGRFVPHQFLEFLNKESIVDVELGDEVEKKMSILFSDIRDFTSISEKMNPKDNFKFINGFFSRMEPAILDNNGFVDKYIGDAIMALFSGCADDAVKAGIAMLQSLNEYNLTRQRPSRQPLRIGIGINTGNLMLGTVGGKSRMDGTVISDAVNLASRVESITKDYEVALLITQATFADLKNSDDYAIRIIAQVQVKGKSQTTLVYEVFDADPPEIKAHKLATKELFEEARSLYEKNLWGEATERFTRCLQQNPRDRVAQIYLERCEQQTCVS